MQTVLAKYHIRYNFGNNWSARAFVLSIFCKKNSFAAYMGTAYIKPCLDKCMATRQVIKRIKNGLN